MQIVNETKDSSVHRHQFHQGHVLVFELKEVLAIEDLFESEHHNINLNVVEPVF